MLSRLMTRREQLLLVGIVVAVCAGAASLYIHDRNAARKEAEKQQAVIVASLPEKPPPLEDPVAPPATTPLPPLPLPEPPRAIAVFASGAVQTPGLYRFQDDARVKDLLDAARGATDDADLSDINNAAKLVDGTTLTVPIHPTARMIEGKLIARNAPSAAELNLPQYTISGARFVPEPPPAPAAAPVATASKTQHDQPEPPANSGLVDLNTASQDMLEALPGIGPKTAEKIIAFRTHTPFASVDDLTNVSGIGPKKLEAIRNYVTVSGASASQAPAPSAGETAAPAEKKARKSTVHKQTSR